MRFALIIAMLACATLCLAQSTVTDYANFKVEDEQVIWRLTYDRKGMDRDSIKRMIATRLSIDLTLQIVDDQPESVSLKMVEKVFEKEGDKITGLLTIEVKDERYRVTLRSMTRTMGIKTMRMASGFGVSDGVRDYNGVRFEDDFLNKARTAFKPNQFNLRGLDFWNKLIEHGFDFTATKKDDW